ncbi:MAG TPA: hypothetical protein VD969_14845 [Symbiobacteriaceae bacterium]|nr:hypothetical protein [Symbiobacteriaceae bacterium]
MSGTYSTRDRDLNRGQLYSSRTTVISAHRPSLPERPVSVGVAIPPPAPAAPAAAPPLAPEQRFTFVLSPRGIVPAPPIGSTAAGSVTVSGRPGEAYAISAQVTGLQPHRDPAIRPALWLIHDLTVPADLAAADVAALPRGVVLPANQPGGIFTVDGNPPTYGKNANTLSIAVCAGGFAQTGPSDWTLTAMLDAATNQTFHPLAVLGPAALGNIDVALPTGTVARTLTDVFMRPATVHPQLPVRTHYAQRLGAVVRDVLAAPGAVSYLAPEQFTRAAVTLEGIVRGTPRLMPTREACCLIANARS